MVLGASNCFLTPFTPMSSVCIEGNCDGPLDGMGSCSLVKTDLKWLFSVLALSYDLSFAFYDLNVMLGCQGFLFLFV